jgi:hypothetical protein
MAALLDQSFIDRNVVPSLVKAVDVIGTATAIKWREAVTETNLWEGEKDLYRESISWQQSENGLTGYVIATYKHAGEIETGRPARDLKRMLNTSQKVRRTKDGRRFLVIPFQHNTKKLQAAGLYGMAKALSSSSVTGTGRRPSGQTMLLSKLFGMKVSPHQTPFLSSLKTKSAMMVPSFNYSWGARLTKAQVGEHKWAQGIYKMAQNTPNSKHSGYLSFRVMIEGSNGWIVPAQPGRFIAKKVAEDMQPKAKAIFAEAVSKIASGT